MTIINKDLLSDSVSKQLIRIDTAPKHMHYYQNNEGQHTFIVAIFSYRVAVIEKGCYHLRANNKDILLNKHDILLIPPFSSYEIVCLENGSGAIIIDYKVNSDEKIASELFNLNLLSTFTDAVDDSFVTHLIDVYKKFYDKELGYYILIKLALQMLFVKMAISYLKDNRIEHTVDIKYSSRIQECVIESLRFIDENMESKDLSVSLLCEHLNVSQSYLYTCFKKIMGSSVQQAISECRLNKSLIYLGNSDLRICDIAEMVGFDNVFYFSNAFKKKYNMSPNQYRKQFH